MKKKIKMHSQSMPSKCKVIAIANQKGETGKRVFDGSRGDHKHNDGLIWSGEGSTVWGWKERRGAYRTTEAR